jgi:ADP-heptose:LPS heptosyltransferase
VVERAGVLLANNSGPAHVAAEVRTPVVVLYALTNPQHTPWRPPSRVLHAPTQCAFCYRSVCPQGHHACLRDVPVARVADAVEELLRGAAAAADASDAHEALQLRVH